VAPSATVTLGSKALSVLMVAGLESPTVAIAPTAVSIEFAAPAGCSSLDSFYRGVRSRTDRVRLAAPGEQAIQIRVSVSRAGQSIRGELRVGDQPEESQTRRVDGVSCNEVVEALSLTAALALDPSASLLAEHAPENEPPPAPAPAASVLPVASSASTPPIEPPSPIGRYDRQAPVRPPSESTTSPSVDLSARAVAASYVSPGLMLGPAAGLRVLMPTRYGTSVTAGVEGFYLSNDLVSAADSSVFRLTGMGISICPVYGAVRGWLELGACTTARGAWLHAKGLGLSHPRSANRAWWTVGLESLASVRLRANLGLEFSAGSSVPLVIREFNSGGPQDQQMVGKTPILSVQVGVGIASRF